MHALPLPRPASFPARTTLTVGDRVVLRAVAEAMFSQDGEVAPERLEAHLSEVDAFVSAASKTLRFGLRVALFVVRIAPILLFFRLRTIERLTVDERVHVLSRLERSPITNLSLAFVGWRTVLTFVVYEHPDELRSLGYSNERVRHKRHLPTLPIAAPVAAPALPPVPLESGVRLANPDSDHEIFAAESAEAADAPREVA